MGQSSSSSSSSSTENRHHRHRNEYYYPPIHSPNPNYPSPTQPSGPPQPFPSDRPNSTPPIQYTPQRPSHPPTSPPPPPPPSHQAMPYLAPPMYNYFAPQPNGRYYPPPPQAQSGGLWHSYGPSAYPTIRPPIGHVLGGSWWSRMGPDAVQVPHVDHEVTKTIKNDVNVHKDTIRLEIDEENPDQHLVEFTFDANFDGSITIFYFAKEGTDCTPTPIYPEMYKPTRIPFQKGPSQKFRQSSGFGIDLGFFELDHLSKPSQGGDIFPLVICAESCIPPPSPQQIDEQLNSNQSPTCSQLTEAVIERKDDGHFKVKVVKQVLWFDGERYEVRDIFGLENITEESFDENDAGKECVICLSQPRDTAVLPCRHMCMCGECATQLTLQSNKCPICRQPVEKLIEIKVKSDER